MSAVLVATLLCGAGPAQTPQGLGPATRVQAAAKRIDQLVEQGLTRAGQQPNPDVDDPTFLRRSYLTVVGRIPTLAETDRFLLDARSDRRERLIDELLQSPGHTSHWTNYWADQFRVRSRLMRQTSGEPFLHWLRESIAQNQPFDEMVREMVTATGAAHERGHGATGFLLRDLGMPHDAMANSLRLFLGTRLECAQCHNHPFDHWTQKEFYQMAAFFGGIQYRPDFQDLAAADTLRTATRDREAGQAARRLLQQLGAGIMGSGTGTERLPADYKYEDAAPRSLVYADTIFGADVQLPKPGAERQARGRGNARPRPQPAADVESREAFAGWLTSPKNPRFAMVIANRMFERVMGRGAIHPIDDLRDDTKAVNPELMSYLTRLVVELRFDLREFERVLLNTRTFRRAAPASEPAEGEPWLFAGPLLRRMTAEQAWDSLVTLVDDQVDQHLPPFDARANPVYERFDQVAKASPEQMQTMIGEQQLRVTDPQKFQQLQRERLRQSAMQRPSAAAAARDGSLQRAADLQHPAPNNHLLRQFGQSEREVIDGGNRAANVPQVLTLLNGFVDQRLLGATSALRRDLQDAGSNEARVKVAFLTMLNRPPREAELALWHDVLIQEGDRGLRDLVWVLCNSHEFRFIR